MQPFNIHFDKQKQAYTLTIQPAEHYFKVIYFGAIIAVIEKQNNQWQSFDDYIPEPGDVPLATYKKGEGIDEPPTLKLSKKDLNTIGAAIETTG